jgi:DNA-binding transcriptional ArsR family regulator
MTTAQPEEPAQSHDGAAAEVLKALAHPVRVQLMRYVMTEEHCVTECMEHTGLSQSLVSQQLGRLVAVGLVERRPDGRRSYHQVRDPSLVSSVLDTAAALARGR